MIRKYAIIGQLVVTAFLLAGCASAPDTQDSNGIKQAKGKAEENISDVISNEKVSSDSELVQYDFLSETENGYVCKVDIGSGDNVLHIDAPIENTGVSDIVSLKVKPLDEDMDRDKVIEVFFDNDTTVRDTLAEKEEEEKNLRPEERMI